MLFAHPELALSDLIENAVSGTDLDPCPTCTGPCESRTERGLWVRDDARAVGVREWVCEDCAHLEPWRAVSLTHDGDAWIGDRQIGWTRQTDVGVIVLSSVRVEASMVDTVKDALRELCDQWEAAWSTWDAAVEREAARFERGMA